MLLARVIRTPYALGRLARFPSLTQQQLRRADWSRCISATPPALQSPTLSAPAAATVPPVESHKSHPTASVPPAGTGSPGSSGKGSSEQQRPPPRFRWRRMLAGGAALLVALPLLKVYLAVRPLRGAAEKDAALIAALTSSVGLDTEGLRAAHRGSLAFLIDEAADRLIRDVWTAVSIVRVYQAAPPEQEDWSEFHQAGADRLLKLCEVNRGIYIKLGQHVGQLEYLLPAPYVKTLKLLTHAAPTDSWATVQRVWNAEFPDHPLATVFESIEQAPLASASLAQVHVGVLKPEFAGGVAGRRVAVKVQHEGLRETSAADIATVAALVRIVKALFPAFDYEWLADEIRCNLPQELDFTLEADNCEATGRAFERRRDVVVPQVYRAFTSPRVLTMSFEEGVYVDRVGAIRDMGLAPSDVALLVSETFSEQVFLHGRAHCDPHAANMLIRPMPASAGGKRKPQLVLLDHGLYRVIPHRLRLDYCKLWRSILAGDEAGIQRYSERMGAGGMYQLWASMLTTRSWDRIMDAGEDIETLKLNGTAAERAETHGYARQYAQEIGVVLRQIPRELLLILKLNDCLRSVDLALGAPVNSMVVTARYTQRALAAEALARHPGLWTRLRVSYESVVLEAKLGLFRGAAALYRGISGWWWRAPATAAAAAAPKEEVVAATASAA